MIGGFRRAREDGFRAGSFFKITNYDTVHRDLDLIAALAPDLVILDEAQRIKNWSTRTARERQEDRLALRHRAHRHAAGEPAGGAGLDRAVRRSHRLGPTFRFLHDHQIRDEVGKVVGYRNLDRIGQTLAPILIRRQKDEVLDQLPERLDKNFFVPMTPQQMQHHEENREIVARIVEKWRRYHFLSEADQRRLMIALQNMRMACDSTLPARPEDRPRRQGRRAGHAARRDLRAPGHQGRGLQPVAADARGARSAGFSGGRGATCSSTAACRGTKRKDLIDRFRDDPRCRAFLSTDAGGVGLNLQHASVVVNMDLPWNPAVLEQRIGRVHRLGQTRPVRVVNFVAQGTIEEGMLSVLGFKKSLFAGVLDGGEKEVFLGGSRLTRFMESVEGVTSGIPAPVVEESPDPAATAPPADEAATDGDAAAAPAVPPPADALGGLLRTGLDLLSQFAAAAGTSPGAGTASSPVFERVRDDRSGQSYLKIRMPEPEVVDHVVGAVQALLEALTSPSR